MVINSLYRFQEPADWIAAPIRLMRVGVFDNEWGDWSGRTFFELDALRRSLPYWNRLSMTVEHPNDFVTNGYDPAIIGAVENVQINREYLVGVAWLNRPSLRQHPGLLRRIESREPIEVTAAYYVNPLHQGGTYRGEQFDFRVQNLIPNHVAILPGSVGAFGLRHGCGLFAPERPVAAGLVTNASGSTRRGKAQPNPLRATRQRPRIEPSPIPPPTPTSRFPG